MSGSVATNFPLGVYLGSGLSAFDASYGGFVSTMGTQPRFVDVFVDHTQPIENWVTAAAYQAKTTAEESGNATPVIDLPMLSNAPGSMTPDQFYQAFASGQYDSELMGIVAAWAKQGFTNLDFRLGSEMNLPLLFSAGSSAQEQADWVAAFQHIYTVLHAAGTADGVAIQVIWNPDADGPVATTTLYPGDAYVDVIGPDVFAEAWPRTDTWPVLTYHDYATGNEDSSLAQWMINPINRQQYWTKPAATEFSNDASKGATESLDALLQFAEAHNKPFALPETGSGNSTHGNDVVDDAAFPQWLAQQLTTAEAAGLKIAFVNIWDANNNGNYAFSDPADGKPLEAAAWAEYFGAHAVPVSPPTITGAAVSLVTMDMLAIHPFSTLTIADSADEIETVTVTESDITHGSFTQLGGGSYDPVAGVYTVSGSAEVVTAALQALVFMPTVVPGAVITDFTVSASNSTATATNSATTLTTEHAYLTFSNQTIDATSTITAGQLSFTDDAGSNIIKGGSSGLRVTVNANNDVVSTKAGSANKIALLLGGNVLHSAGTDTVTMGSGNEIVTATGAATITSGKGTNAFGFSGTDSLTSVGTDYVRITSGSSTIKASGRAISVSMTAGSVQLTETGGGDQDAATVSGAAVITGGAGRGGLTITTGITGPSTVTLGLGNNIVTSQNADTIYAGAGSTLLSEGTLGATFIAGAGPATVTEGAGTGNLTFGSGSTTAIGGSGQDLYSFINGSGGGNDMIYNFRAGVDQLSFTGFTGAPVQTQTLVAGGLSIGLADQTAITLVGVTNLLSFT